MNRCGLPITSCLLKLRRAREHLDTLNDEIQAWLDRHPYGLIHKRDPQGTIHRVIMRLEREPAVERWSLIAADCFHNLRTTLDQLLYWIAVYETGQNPPPDEERIQFPICDDPKSFASKNTQKRIIMLSTSVRTVIEAHQPYNRWHKVVPPLLSVLRDIDDVDKHRLLQLVVTQIANWEFSNVSYAIPPGEGIRVRLSQAPIVGDTEIAAFMLERPTPEMKFEVSVALAMALSHRPGPGGAIRSGVISLAVEIASEVELIIDRICDGAVT